MLTTSSIYYETCQVVWKRISKGSVLVATVQKVETIEKTLKFCNFFRGLKNRILT